MTEAELRNRLLGEALPGEIDAEERSWAVVHEAYLAREAVPPARRPLRPLLVLAALAVLVGAVLSPPGQSVAGWIRDRVATEEESGAPLSRLPTAGRLLVTSAQGAWVVHADGSKRFLGAYEEASWSPHGLYVVAARGRRLTAVEPDGHLRWSLSRTGKVSQARWAPSGLRIAYRSGGALRVVDGNGTDDRLLVRRPGPAPAAWRPGLSDLLAYEDARGRVHLRDLSTGVERWRSQPFVEIRELMWSSDGARLVILSGDRRLDVLRGDGKLVRTWEAESGVIVRVAFAPAQRALALTTFDVDAEAGRGSVALLSLGNGRARELTSPLRGSVEDVVWSPNGRWLLVGWSAADQWLFLRLPGVSRIDEVSNVTREFDPGGVGEGAFPRVAGWVAEP